MLTLLLADPSPAVRRVVEAAFADRGVEVVCAASGDEAFRRVAETRPDVVLVDVALPGPGGYEVCERVKAACGREVPVLLLADALHRVDDGRARAAGSDGVLSKPLETGFLVARIQDLVSRESGDCFDQLARPVARVSGHAADDEAADQGEVPTLEDVLTGPPRGEADLAGGDDERVEALGLPTLERLLGGKGASGVPSAPGASAPEVPSPGPALTDEFVEAVTRRVTERLAAEHGAAIEQAVARAVQDAVEPDLRAAVEAGVSRLLEQAAAEIARVAHTEVSRVAMDVVVDVSERLVREEIARIRGQA